MFKKILVLIAVSLFAAGGAFAGELVNVSGASGIAVDGFDPVAFFTEEKAVHGDPSLTATYRGATYLFSSAENQKLFENSPERYAPQFGGFCAYGAAVGALFPVDIDTWQVREGKLYFNLNPQILDALNQDFSGNVKKAKKNWKGLVGEYGG